MQPFAFFLIRLALCAVSTFGQTESAVRNRLAGMGKLVSMEEILKDGTTRPFSAFGPHAKGLLM